MIEVLLAAPASGSGKTAMTCALLRALQRRNLHPCAFKCGPDYIDPMFHRAVLGVPSHNLDLFLAQPQTVRTLYANACRNHGAAVCEGVMGFYDGVGGVTAQGQRLADSRYPRPAGAAGGTAQRGQSDAGGTDSRTASLPHPQPFGGHFAQRLHSHAGGQPGPHAGAGDRAASAGMSAAPGPRPL